MSANSETDSRLGLEFLSPFEILKNALSLEREAREEDDHDVIANEIYNLKFFQLLVSNEGERLEFVKNCSKYFKYKLYPKGSEVFRKGDKGQNFYIILKGDAAIFVPKSEEELKRDNEDEEKKLVFKKYSETFGNKHPASLPQCKLSNFVNLPKRFEMRKRVLTEEIVLPVDLKEKDFSFEEKLLFINDTNNDLTPYFIKDIAVYKKFSNLQDGDSFGELALIFNQPRLASIIATEDLHLLSLTSSDYLEIFQSEVANSKHKVQFFQQIFKTVPCVDIIKFCSFIKEKPMKFNDILYKEGENCLGIHFIKYGDIQLSKCYKLQSKDSKVRRRSSTHFRRVIATSLMDGGFFGDWEIITMSKASYTATCTKNTLLYKLPKEAYFNVVEKYLPSIAQFLKEAALTNNRKWKSQIEANEKIQLSVLPSYEDNSPKSSHLVFDEIKDASERFIPPPKRTSLLLPLSKYETISSELMKTYSSELQYDNSPKEKITYVSTPKRSSLLLPQIDTNGQRSSPFGQNFSGRNSPGIMITLPKCQDSPCSTFITSASPKLNLPEIASPKSCLSGNTRDSADDGFTSVVNKWKASGSDLTELRSQTENSPTNVLDSSMTNFFTSAKKPVPKRYSLHQPSNSYLQGAQPGEVSKPRGSLEMKTPVNVSIFKSPRSKLKQIEKFVIARAQGFPVCKLEGKQKINFEKLF